MFVEEFILDRTLTPALDEFGLETVRMIDPTCGSGHFLLGAFARLFDLWSKREPATRSTAAQKALDGVHGVDINPFAVAIARFRLIVAAVQACGIKRLKQGPGLEDPRGDSATACCSAARRIRAARRFRADWLATDERARGPERSTPARTRKALQEILGQAYHVVVGNPPYITVKDPTLERRATGADTRPATGSTRSACRSPSGSSTWRSAADEWTTVPATSG